MRIKSYHIYPFLSTKSLVGIAYFILFLQFNPSDCVAEDFYGMAKDNNGYLYLHERLI